MHSNGNVEVGDELLPTAHAELLAPRKEGLIQLLVHAHREPAHVTWMTFFLRVRSPLRSLVADESGPCKRYRETTIVTVFYVFAPACRDAEAHEGGANVQESEDDTHG